MKKILALIVIGVIGYFGYNHYTDNKVEEIPEVTSTTHIKAENKTAVPISYALFEWPKDNNIPMRHGVIQPGDHVQWNAGEVPLGEYMWYGIVSGDGSDKGGLWDYQWPGVDEMITPFELGFKLWHEGDIDWIDIKTMDKNNVDSCFGKQYTYVETGKFSWNGMNSSSIHQFKGGPNWVIEPDTLGQSKLDSIYRVGHPQEELQSTDLKCKLTN